jgi:hypothetical protein
MSESAIFKNAINGTMNQELYLALLWSLLEAAQKEGLEIGGNTAGFFTTTKLQHSDLFPEIES